MNSGGKQRRRWYSLDSTVAPTRLISAWLRLRATATKLGTRIFLYAFLSILAPVILYSLVGNQALSMSNERALEERLVMAQVVASNLDRAFQNAFSDLQQVAASGNIDLEDGNSTPERVALANLFAHQWLFSYGVVIFDSSGRPIYREPEALQLAPEPFISSVRIPLALKENRPTVTAGRPSSPDGHYVLALSVPLHDRQGNPVAVLSGLVDLNKPTIKSLLDPLALGKTGQAEIIDDHGLVIASTRPDVAIEPSQHGPRFVSLIKGGQTTVGTCHGCHEGGNGATSDREVLAFAPLETAPSGVIIRQGEREALAFSRWLQERLVVFGIGALVVAMFLAQLTARGVLAPIRALSEACARIGAGDLSVGVKPTSSDEIGALADAFEKMRLQLRASLEEIQQWNRQLEERVRLRTQQLQERTLELQQRNRELSALYTTSATLSQTLELDRVLREGLDTVLQLFDVEAGGIMTWNEECTGLEFRVHRGFSPDFVEGVAGLAAGEGISGRAAQTRQPVLVDDLSTDPLVTRSVARAEGIRSFVAIPLEANEKIFGVLNLGSHRQRPFAPEEIQLLKAVGHQIAVAINNAQLFEEAGKAQALRALDRAKSELLSTVSHELRTPLAGIKAHATALLRTDVERDQDTIREYLHVVVEESDRLRLLIENLLDMTRIESGAMKIDKRPVQIADVALAVVSSMRRNADLCQLTVDFEPDFPVVEVDQRRIEQVLRNLVDNAVKYSPHGGNVVIRGVRQGGEVLVCVSDEGIGIRASDLELIFERFHRVDSPVVRRAGGAGLGLAICRGIIEAHGGRIWAESTPGKGTTIRFTLPLTEGLLADALAMDEMTSGPFGGASARE